MTSAGAELAARSMTAPAAIADRGYESPALEAITEPNSYHSFTRRSRSALAMTLTEESDIAAAATIGDSRMPNAG